MFLTKIDKHTIVNSLFLFLPISFVSGNLFININIILLIIITFTFYFSKIINIDFNIYDKLIILFYLIVLFSGVYNSYLFYFPEKSMYAKEILIKSFFFVRFVLLYFVIKYLISNDVLKLKFFFIISALSSLFVASDVLLQFITGQDIFGYESFDRRNPGPFGDEAISGSFLQRFSLFIFFLIPIYFKRLDNQTLLLFTFLLFLLIFCATLFSGNKFPFVMFILSLIILMLLLVRSKKLIIFIFIICSIIFTIFNKYSYEVKNNTSSFFNGISQVRIYTSSIFDKFENGSEIVIPNTWLKEIHNGILAFNTKKIFGGGLKSYKISCPKVSKQTCNQHPHNYHIEILVSSGVVGYLVLLTIFLKIFYDIFIKNYYGYKRDRQLLLILFFTLLFIEFFPLKTAGSFFSTANATYFFIIMSITISLGIRKKT